MKKYKTLPNLIIIGAQKAGTTSLFNWLAQHPEIYGDESLKDFNFFLDDFYYKELGIEWFSKQFKPKNNEKIIMHGFVNYMYFYDIAIERLYEYKKKYRKDLKLIAILRNPIDRAYSAFWDAKKVTRENASTFEEAFKKEKFILAKGSYKEKASLTYIDHGFYFIQLKNFKKIFREDIKILIFEELISNPEREIKNLFKWLSIDETFLPSLKKINESGLPKNLFIQKFIQQLSAPKFLKGIIPMRIKYLKWKLSRELNIKKINYPPINEETRKYLLNVYIEDIKNLEKLLGKDLSIWLK